MTRTRLILAFLTLFGVTTAATAVPPVRFFETHCRQCHDADELDRPPLQHRDPHLVVLQLEQRRVVNH